MSHSHTHGQGHSHAHTCRNEDQASALKSRLARIEGQVRGISRMIEGDEDCVEILIQINAARAAMQRVARLVLEDHLKHCVVDSIKDGNEESVLNELNIALEQFSKII